MDDRVLTSLQGIEGPADDVLTCLGKHLQGDVIRNHIPLDQRTEELIFRLGCRRESDFDLLESDLDQKLEEIQFRLQIHGHYECLVSVPKVNRAPDRRFVNIILLRPLHLTDRRVEELLLVFGMVHHSFGVPPYCCIACIAFVHLRCQSGQRIISIILVFASAVNLRVFTLQLTPLSAKRPVSAACLEFTPGSPAPVRCHPR